VATAIRNRQTSLRRRFAKATEGLFSMTLTGTPVTLHLVGVFEVDRDGKVTTWRDCSDSREVAVEVGADLAAQDRSV